MRASKGAVIAKVLIGKRNAVDATDLGPVASFDTLGEETVENARELLQLVKQRIENRYGYIKLFSLLIFFALYLKAISVQQNVHEAFEIESRYEIIHDFILGLKCN
jgi:hypothetical protein